MKILLQPLVKIALLAEQQKVVLEEIHSVLSVDLKAAAVSTAKELSKQTVLLTDIRDLIKEQIKAGSGSKDEKGGKLKMPSIMGGVAVGIAVVSIAAAILVAAGIFSLVPAIGMSQMITILAVAGLFTILAPVFVDISESLRGGGLFARIVGKKAGVSSGISGIKDLLQNVGGTGLAMVTMAIGVAASSWILQLVMPVSGTKLMAALIIGVVFIPLSLAFGQIVKALRRARIKPTAKGIGTLAMVSVAMATMALGLSLVAMIWNKMMPDQFVKLPPVTWILKAGLILLIASFSFATIARAVKGMSVKDLAFTAIAMGLVAVGIVGAAMAFMLLENVTKWVAPPLMWSLKAGIALLLFGGSFLIIAKAVKGMSVKDLAFTAIAMGLVAGSIIAVAWIFTYLEGVSGYNAPPVEWTLKAGLALLVFGIPFVIIAALSKYIGIKGMLMATAAAPLIAISILAVAWIFQLLPSEWKAPPLDWSIAAAQAIGVFGIPFAIIAAAAILLTPVGLLLGAAGMILIAGTMWVVAWIFSKMPDVGGAMDGFTQAILAPVNGMIDALIRFKDGIGIENMLPLAGGLLAIAGGWLALTAALAGSAASGLFGSVANLGSSIIDGISGLFGGKKTKTPIELLDALLTRGPAIAALADPMKQFGIAFAKIANKTEVVIRGLGAFSAFMDEDNVEQLEDSGKAIEMIAKGYTTIAKASNSMNIDAIYASTRMFEAIARISEADGEDAMTVLTEQLLEAVKQLAETVSELEKTTESQSSGLGDAISGAMATFVDKITGAKDEAGGESQGLVDIGPIVDAIADLEARFSRPILVQED